MARSMPLCALMSLLWASCGSSARSGDDMLKALPNGKELAAAPNGESLRTYDPKMAARMGWWSKVAVYGSYKLENRYIGTGDLEGKVWLAGSSEVLIFKEGRIAHVIFRGTTFETWSDVVADLEIMSVTYEPGSNKWGSSRWDAVSSLLRPWLPRMHRGFAARANSYFAAILVAFDKLFDDDPSQIERIVFSGHSLGGAVAQATAFCLKGWLEKVYSLQGEETLNVPSGVGMSRGLEFKRNSTHKDELYIMNDSPKKLVNKHVSIEVYTFSAPKLGTWHMKMEYEKKLPSSFNHVYGLDLVPLVPPWEHSVGWQLRSSPTAFSPSVSLNVVQLHTHVLQAFLGFFRSVSGEKCDEGYYDVTKRLTGMVDAEQANKEADEIKTGSEKHKYGSDVKVNIKPPGLQSKIAPVKFIFSYVMDYAMLGLFPIVGLYLYYVYLSLRKAVGEHYKKHPDVYKWNPLAQWVWGLLPSLGMLMVLVFFGEVVLAASIPEGWMRFLCAFLAAAGGGLVYYGLYISKVFSYPKLSLPVGMTSQDIVKFSLYPNVVMLGLFPVVGFFLRYVSRGLRKVLVDQLFQKTGMVGRLFQKIGTEQAKTVIWFFVIILAVIEYIGVLFCAHIFRKKWGSDFIPIKDPIIGGTVDPFFFTVLAVFIDCCIILATSSRQKQP